MRAKRRGIRSSRLIALLGVVTPGVLVLTAGCSGPRYEKRRFERDTRIEETWQLMERREARSEENLRKLRALTDKLEQDRRVWAEHLRARIRDKADEDMRWWAEGREERHEWLHALFDGRPESIEDAWARMTY